MKDILLTSCIVLMSLSAPIHLSVPGASTVQSASRQSHAAIFTEPTIRKDEKRRKQNDDDSGTPLPAIGECFRLSTVGV